MPISGLDFLRSLKSSQPLPVYYLYGQEELLIDKAVERLIKKALPESAREFNLQRFYAPDSTPSDILDSALTTPAFSPYRLVIVKDIDISKHIDLDEFLPYIERPSPSTILVFTGRGCDMRRRFFTTIDKKKGTVEFAPLKRGELSSWIRDEFKEREKNITQSAIELLIETAGEGLRALLSEIEKLANYMGDKGVIDEEAVERLAAPSRVVGIFEYIDALSERDMVRAWRLLKRLFDEGEPAPKVLSLISRHFRILWLIKIYEGRGYSFADMQRRLRIPKRFLQRYVRQSKGFTDSQLRKIHTRILYADSEIKRGLMPPLDVLETLTIDLSLKDCELNLRLGFQG